MGTLEDIHSILDPVSHSSWERNSEAEFRRETTLADAHAHHGVELPDNCTEDEASDINVELSVLFDYLGTHGGNQKYEIQVSVRSDDVLLKPTIKKEILEDSSPADARDKLKTILDEFAEP